MPFNFFADPNLNGISDVLIICAKMDDLRYMYIKHRLMGKSSFLLYFDVYSIKLCQSSDLLIFISVRSDQ